MITSAPTTDHGYDKLASVYGWLEWLAFGSQLMRARVILLEELASHVSRTSKGRLDRILVLGDGDGRLLAKLRQRFPSSDFVSVDASSKMLRKQKACCTPDVGEGTIEWVLADATTHPFKNETYDLLVVAFFLDCFTEMELLEHLPGWLESVNRGGLVYYVDFIEPPSGWRKLNGRVMLRTLHFFFGWFTNLENRALIPVGPLLEPFCGQPIVEKQLHAGMMVARIYERA